MQEYALLTLPVVASTDRLSARSCQSSKGRRGPPGTARRWQMREYAGICRSMQEYVGICRNTPGSSSQTAPCPCRCSAWGWWVGGVVIDGVLLPHILLSFHPEVLAAKAVNSTNRSAEARDYRFSQSAALFVSDFPPMRKGREVLLAFY